MIQVRDVGNDGDGEKAGFSKMVRVGGREGLRWGGWRPSFWLGQVPVLCEWPGPWGRVTLSCTREIGQACF